MREVNWDAPHLLVSPLAELEVKSKKQFLPVCRYPLDAPTPLDREIGSLVKLKGDEVTEVIRRVIGTHHV